MGRLDPELTRVQRSVVAAATFRPSRSSWVERFYKSGLAHYLRSRNAGRQEAALGHPNDPVFQVHQLFDVPGRRSVLYIDCTHRQSARSWPAWNPLSGWALERWYARERAAFHGAEHIFAFSEPTRSSLLQDYGVHPDRVTVVGAGANFDELPAIPAARAEPVILFIGNDFVRKGGQVLVDAFRIVRQRIPGARLQLAGSQPDVPPQPGLEVLGRIRDRGRVAELYAQARVFCLPSFFDPFPLVLLEAMAYGLPVIASTSCGIPEIVAEGRTGRLVAAGDVQATAAALVRLLNSPDEAARLGAAGRARVERFFTWDQVVERMVPELQHVIGEQDVSHR